MVHVVTAWPGVRHREEYPELARNEVTSHVLFSKRLRIRRTSPGGSVVPRGTWWVWWLQVPNRSRGNSAYGPGLSARSWSFQVPFSSLLEMYWEEATTFSRFQVGTLVAGQQGRELLA